MQYFKDTIDIEKIETKTMYKMIYYLLDFNFYYESKCLVNLFIEKRKNKEELETLNEIRDLLFEYKINEAKEISKLKI